MAGPIPRNQKIMMQLLKRLLPKLVKSRLSALIRKMLQNHWQQADRLVPKYQLQEKHFAQLTAVANREALLKLLPKNGVVAELGVNKGEFSAKILALSHPAILHLVDMWGPIGKQQKLQKQVEWQFASEINVQKVVLHVGSSTAMAAQFADHYFDWIYIDTDHSYITTKAELEKYAPKMKPNGIISGHDFTIGNWNGSVKYGVIEAVYEFCVLYNWEIIYLTMEQNEHPSFAIRRLS